jgi:hypothetical protein
MNEFGLISIIIGIVFLIFAILVKPTKQSKH